VEVEVEVELKCIMWCETSKSQHYLPTLPWNCSNQTISRLSIPPLASSVNNHTTINHPSGPSQSQSQSHHHVHTHLLLTAFPPLAMDKGKARADDAVIDVTLSDSDDNDFFTARRFVPKKGEYGVRARHSHTWWFIGRYLSYLGVAADLIPPQTC
jgi:hypothetical protein